METKKILLTSTFFPPYHIGGDALHVFALAHELQDRGYEVHVIHLLDSYYFKRGKGGVPRDDEFVTDAQIHSIKSQYGFFSLLSAYSAGVSRAIDRRVEAIIDEIHPDVLHHHNIAGFGPSILFHHAPNVLYTAHDYWLVCPLGSMMFRDSLECGYNKNCTLCLLANRRPPQLWRRSNLFNSERNQVRTIISPSEYVRDVLIRYGIKQDVVHIPNFIDPPPDDESSNPPVFEDFFLFVGVLEHHKGILDLIQVFREVRNKNLVIIGTGSLEGKIRESLNAEGDANIRYLGRVAKKTLFHYYRNANAVIIPSLWPENNPLVALESLSVGTPIIVSNRGGLPEIAGKIGATLIFDPCDFGQLKRIIEEFQGSRADIKEIFDDNYSQEAFFRQYIPLIKE
ncbi:glycosyltransferase involved in cell wall biosynthesis [Methanolinea mesophila]|uniref:glycosyltransferase n=1 Tax=Methanolinea mesophila TaxID=547055 RepID=UPI001AE1EC04|nr:glycosyltransferase [Methanolinea mesophila]MBP1928354.1 glycosyltransferase involved in cell wall biosynthesis [Methanolinea mesophila]